MADKVTNIPALGARPAKDDKLYIVDKSDLTDGAGGTSKSIEIDELLDGLPKILTGYDGYVILPGPTSTDRYLAQTGDIFIGKGAYYSGKMVMMVALQDTPTLDAHFDAYLKASAPL